MNVLIVDDDTVDRESIKRSLILSSFDCEIDEAVDVDLASAMCENKNYDVVLLDYRLPKRDGVELLRELRKKNISNTEVIVMMSNSEDEKLALDCLQAGAQDFLLKKEISGAKLRRAIVHAQKRFELEQELRVSFMRVKYLAERDSLTGLANRFLFDETFKMAVSNHSRSHATLALLLFDIDNFKLINDTYGHNTGDELLKQVCIRITEVLRDDNLFARIGGDEFTIMLSNLSSPLDAAGVAERIHNCLVQPFLINGHILTASISIGISVYNDENANTAEEMLKFADIAMYRSKCKGPGKLSFFRQGMQEQAERRLALENGLSRALDENEFYLCYQPVFHAGTLELTGFEALLRWETKDGLISPQEFIPIAEKTHKINEIGRWVVTEAVRQLGIWNKQRETPLSMAINISPIQLNEENFAFMVASLCDQHQVSAKLLEFELTETALFDQTKPYIIALENIVALNCTLALDDFGTGYSSITHLLNTPLTTVKLDKSLLSSEIKPQKEIVLLNGLVQMLKSLNLKIVAEGVETYEHEQLSRELEVDRLQGFYYSPGLRAEQVAQQYLQ